MHKWGVGSVSFARNISFGNSNFFGRSVFFPFFLWLEKHRADLLGRKSKAFLTMKPICKKDLNYVNRTFIGLKIYEKVNENSFRKHKECC